MIHYLVPSRGRPQNAARLLMAWQCTCISDAGLLFCLDDDDPTLPEYLDIIGAATRVRSGAVIHKRLRMGPTLDYWAVQYAKANPTDIIGFMGDDHLPQTAGWDVELQVDLDAMGVGIWYGNDTIQRGAIPTAVAMTANIINELGYMVLPDLIHMYIDNFWKALGDGSQTLRYRDDIIIEHIHPLAGKTAWDAGYVEVNDGKIYEHDGLLFQAYRQSQRYADDVNKIIKLKENHATTT